MKKIIYIVRITTIDLVHVSTCPMGCFNVPSTGARWNTNYAIIIFYIFLWFL